MNKELLQQALNEAKADAIEVFTYEDGIAQSARDAIEYMHSWLAVYFEKQALAQQEQSANRVYLVATGEVHEGQETYTRHDTPPPLCDYETLFTQTKQEQPASVDAYVGAREDAAIWKKRALEAEELNRKFIAEVNGPTYLGEPVKQEQPAQKPDLWKTQFLTDVMTAAGLLRYGRTDKKLAQRIADGSARWRTELYTHPAPTQPALSDKQILDIFGKVSADGMGHYMTAVGRAIEAHCRGGANK